MKLRNKILAMAVIAVAGVNVYLANNVQVKKNCLSLLNLENIAEASTLESTSVDGRKVDIVQNGESVTVIEYFKPDEAPNGGIRNTTYCDGMSGEECPIVLGSTQVAKGYGNRF